MRCRAAIVVLATLLLASASAADGQRRRTPARKPPPPPPLKTEAAEVKCAEELGTGVRSKATYCFVLAGRDPAQGVIITIPPHTGDATLTFDLHNRHTYSEEEMRAGRAFAKYSAVIGLLTMDGQLLARAAVRSEFRAARDLHERISGGAGPGGVKAVAPIGLETIVVTVPPTLQQISLLGEVLEAMTPAGRETATPGRPVALVSNVRVSYRPAPAPRKR
jgi:hypothetical protein